MTRSCRASGVNAWQARPHAHSRRCGGRANKSVVAHQKSITTTHGMGLPLPPGWVCRVTFEPRLVLLLLLDVCHVHGLTRGAAHNDLADARDLLVALIALHEERERVDLLQLGQTRACGGRVGRSRLGGLAVSGACEGRSLATAAAEHSRHKGAAAHRRAMGSPASCASVRSTCCTAASSAASEKPMVGLFMNSLTRLGPWPSVGPQMTRLVSLSAVVKFRCSSSCSSVSLCR